MSLTIKISGVYCSPLAQPIPGVTLEFVSQCNSAQTQLMTTVSTITGADAAYAIELVPNAYIVSEISGNKRKRLGNIKIYPDSVPGTINEYLTAFKPDQMQPGILAEMEEILKETKQAADEAGVNPRGAYDASVQYAKNGLVQFQGSQYRATTGICNVQPPVAPWELFVSAGKDGPPNILTVDTVTTLPAGSMATVEIIGDTPNQTINFGIPQGESGASSVPASWDAPGSYVFGYYTVAAGESYLSPGATVPASAVSVGDVQVSVSGGVTTVTLGWVKHPSGGTWRLQGSTGRRDTVPDITSMQCGLVFVRIDNPPAITLTGQPGAVQYSARNCRYTAADHSIIDCEIQNADKWLPFTASPEDSTTYGPIIYQNAVAGLYGEVSPYVQTYSSSYCVDKR
ncbi:prophage tail fiber N-terminal domain-containing protein [Pseudescherichia vulneris]